MSRAEAVLTEIGIVETVLVSHGVTTGGGTPAARWLEVAVDGIPSGLKICAATEEEAEELLEEIAESVVVGAGARTELSVIKPDDWPAKGIFGSWGTSG